jgi:lipopolysaccharide biosynthesis protein
MHSRRALKLVAHYFPQLHRIPENDAWWGEGFTDWTNVERATPLYAGHHQPRRPVGGAYDQAQLSTITRQVELARSHGVGAFMHYHYWFDGKQLLETPTNLFLGHRELDHQICLCWANETWSRRWDGQDHLVLIEQTHPDDRARWALHFEYLQKAFTDPRALTVDGKPLFAIYRPQKIPSLAQMLDYFRERAHALGLPGLYLVAIDQSRPGDSTTYRYFDAQVRFEPFSTYFELREQERPRKRLVVNAVRSLLPARGVNLVQRVLDKVDDLVGGPTRIDYAKVWDAIVARELPRDRVVFPGAFVDWDNTARYRGHATVFEGANPATFERGLRALAEKVSARPADEQLVFVNAWNEWGEGCYLEPDEMHGMAYLDACKRATST